MHYYCITTSKLLPSQNDQTSSQSSRCGGLLASRRAGRPGSSPDRARRIKGSGVATAAAGHNCGLDLIPRPGTPYAVTKKEKKKPTPPKQTRTFISAGTACQMVQGLAQVRKQTRGKQACRSGRKVAWVCWRSFQVGPRLGPATKEAQHEDIFTGLAVLTGTVWKD